MDTNGRQAPGSIKATFPVGSGGALAFFRHLSIETVPNFAPTARMLLVADLQERRAGGFGRLGKGERHVGWEIVALRSGHEFDTPVAAGVLAARRQW